MNWLRRAIDVGFDKPNNLVRDPDLESLHGPAFDSLVETARANYQLKKK